VGERYVLVNFSSSSYRTNL